MLTIAISVAGLSALGFVLHHLRKAPEGYEDERGFYMISRVSGSKVMRSPKVVLPALRSAKASR